MTEIPGTLRAKLAALHQSRLETWPAAKLAANIRQRARLVADADPTTFVKPGDLVADFAVPEVDGATLRLSVLLAQGPVVLVFFRHGGCPACNIALPHYDATLADEIAARGATLLALSPQLPDRLAAIKSRHALPFPVASDTDNAIARRFGILYSYDEESRAASTYPIGDVTGTGTWELPMPAVIVVGADRRVRFVDVSPDWLVRTEAGPVLAAVRNLTRNPVAA